ncbi:hypothetical protein ES677_05275 [Bizionia gelidisalsuginis]|uniref:Tetracycline regulation of excision, RteC n=1 Tax=Bizionia gelidisalsuginis TaxID=291188 RepID=A0ABY3MBU2_9FLAO|nr:RteC domain-containing protein [Bizionia gelidisalsuginis]TYC14792.1 hypothetical protein ES677_05275 [Bizionia gelidisalsuginis]
MDKINTLVDEYKFKVTNSHQDNLNEITNLRHLINLSSEYLQLLRLSVRQRGFNSESDEILFFKKCKPFVSGHLKYFSHIHSYLMNRPKVSSSRQRKFIHLILDKYEAHKSRELEFVKYYRHKSTRYDHIYFVRGLNSIDITNNINHFIDPEFSTSHDDKVAKIIAYDLLISYFQKELENLKSKKKLSNPDPTPPLLEKLSWTASKTDLVELMYAINAIGALNIGKVDIKSQAKIYESLFGIELGNFYKTYGEIKAREKNRTKFLDNLKYSLLRKMDSDDAN